ncbi:hypothetical protein PENFLA_c084G08738 [Penicillium flavigenum]|uniref:Uncharacterized protein n=1 Tax=Penicillium flavigenum TaxID=254877 RepID=A0A1V6S9B8_9EURO|nr:hypothetical protein PENFLA_c084G08738 [Penicillium flavigenum]
MTQHALRNAAINQVLKACQITMQSAALLEKEVSELRAANEKQKQKRTRSRRQIPAEEGLSVQEASALIMQPVEAVEAPTPGPGIHGESALQPRTKPPEDSVKPASNVAYSLIDLLGSYAKSFIFLSPSPSYDPTLDSLVTQSALTKEKNLRISMALQAPDL